MIQCEFGKEKHEEERREQEGEEGGVEEDLL